MMVAEVLVCIELIESIALLLVVGSLSTQSPSIQKCLILLECSWL